MRKNIQLGDWIIPYFRELFKDIMEHNHTHYINKGGRGSTKSSFIALMIIILLCTHEDICVLCLRKVANTVQTSIFPQIKWWIYKLGIENEFFMPKRYNTPIVYKKTGQKIFFSGLDDAGKVKSFKPERDNQYLGITWFEEFDQFSAEEVRNVIETTIRGRDFWYFYSFNPPISKNNWANVYAEEARLRPNTLVTSNTYLDVPREWLGDAFFEEAEMLKLTNIRAYNHEYMGEATGTGGDVFENVVAEDLSKIVPVQWSGNGEVLKRAPRYTTFDHIYNGIDWGYAVDPFRFTRSHYDRRTHELYIFDEYSTKMKRNEEVFDELFNKYKKVQRGEMITADSAEPKSIDDFHAYGARIRGAQKGADSVRYGIQWLQGLAHIYIDPVRCPLTYKEFVGYEYPRDKNGDFLSVYPDKDNHSIDSVRYALEPIWNRRGL